MRKVVFTFVLDADKMLDNDEPETYGEVPYKPLTNEELAYLIFRNDHVVECFGTFARTTERQEELIADGNNLPPEGNILGASVQIIDGTGIVASWTTEEEFYK